jgi:signal peptidase I
VQDDNYPDDMYQFEASRTRTKNLFDPSNFSYRSESARYRNGTYIPTGRVLPLGDNRDNSRDGRYFGPVLQKKINGSVRFRFWPFKSIGFLGNK